MGFVDSHCHASLQWYEPIETLLFEMDRNDVDQAVLIQINGQYDNSYQHDCVRRYPERLASVVLVDSRQPEAPRALERLAAAGASGRPSAAGRALAWRRSAGHLARCGARLGSRSAAAAQAPTLARRAFAELLAALPDLTR